MLRRKAYRHLVAWKEKRQGRTALLVEGARRVGKSTLVETFAQNEYQSYVLIDFSKTPDEVRAVFETMRHDMDSFFMYLSAFYGVRLYERDTLFIFDEVQLYPKAREFIKHLVADGRYDYVETGSLVSIKHNVADILIPSEEEAFVLNPFDFEEFLWALEEEPLVAAMQDSAQNLKPLPQPIHQKCMRLFREYMLVGGMPSPLSVYVATRDFEQADDEKRQILSLYRKDIARYARGYEHRVISVFDEIPSQLSKHEKKFTLASLGKDTRMRNYDDAFFWLADAQITNMCYNSTDPHVGLGLYRDSPTFKCYLADTGLLVTHAFSENPETSHQVYRDILFDRLQINEGMLTENIVAQTLRAAGRKLYFYSRYSKENSEDRVEIDFLISGGYPHAKVSPLEVKSTKRYTTTSLEKFSKKFGSRVGHQYVLHPGNLNVDNNRVLMPLYLALWLPSSASSVFGGDGS